MERPIDQIGHGRRHPGGVGERAHRAASRAHEGARVVGRPVEVSVGEPAHARREHEEQGGGQEAEEQGADRRQREVRAGNERVEEDPARDQEARRQGPARRVGGRPADHHPHVHEPVAHDGVRGEGEPEEREVGPVHAQARGARQERHDDPEGQGAHRGEAGPEEDVVELGAGEAGRVPELSGQVGEGPRGAHDHVGAQHREGRTVDRLEVARLLEADAGDDPWRERQAGHEQAEEGHHRRQERPPSRRAGEHDGEVGERHRHERRRRPEHPHHDQHDHRIDEAPAHPHQRAPHREGRRERGEPPVDRPARVAHPDRDSQRHLDQRDQEEADDRRHVGASCRADGRG